LRHAARAAHGLLVELEQLSDLSDREELVIEQARVCATLPAVDGKI
jgi:hypothetical protein